MLVTPRDALIDMIAISDFWLTFARAGIQKKNSLDDRYASNLPLKRSSTLFFCHSFNAIRKKKKKKIKFTPRKLIFFNTILARSTIGRFQKIKKNKYASGDRFFFAYVVTPRCFAYNYSFAKENTRWFIDTIFEYKFV